MNAVKFAEGTDNIIEGLAIPFGKDLDGEDFGPDTDLCLDWFPDEGRPFLYHHGLDEAVKTAVVGRQIERWTDDLGHWVKVQLDRRSKYLDAIREMVERKELGLSSGAMPHLVNTRKDGHIERWPWVELSSTPSPAHTGAVLYAVKTADAIEHITRANSSIPAALKAVVETMEDGFTEQTPEALEPEPDAEDELVLARTKAWVDKVANRVEMRASPTAGGRKAGRELSKRNLETLREMQRIINEMMERFDKPDADEAEAGKSVAEFLRLEAEMLGIGPG